MHLSVIMEVVKGGLDSDMVLLIVGDYIASSKYSLDYELV